MNQIGVGGFGLVYAGYLLDQDNNVLFDTDGNPIVAGY